MKVKLILCVVSSLLFCETMLAQGWLTNIINAGVQIKEANNRTTVTNANRYAEEQEAAYNEAIDKGFNIDKAEWDKQTIKRGEELYGRDLNRVQAWENASGTFNKAATVSDNYFDEYQKATDKDVTSNKNPVKQYVSDNLKYVQQFIDAKGDAAVQTMIVIGSIASNTDKVLVRNKLEKIDADEEKYPGIYDDFEIDDRGTITYKPDKHFQNMRNKYESFVSKQQNQGITQKEFEQQYWESLNTKLEDVISGEPSKFVNVAELQRQEEERREAERQAAEERKNAIEKITAAKIDGYDFDETALSQDRKSTLDGIAVILHKYPDVKALIVGHTCEIGYKNINLKKGLKRAEAGKAYLVEKGISADRISVDSKGETQPFVPNISVENRKQNRRIEFVIQ
jgi:outer membrane protein OmpA-like peptidoglycan-associated protein